MKRTFKKSLAVILSVVMLIATMPFASVVAAESNTTTYRLVYEVVDGEATILGCTGDTTELNIPSEIDGYPVTSIGETAFSYCDSLTSIVIPDSVTSIGCYAFEICSSLTSITIPDSVTNIGHGAFYSCYSLTSIVIPDSVTSIGCYAFENCSSLTSITIPDSVTSIGRYAFENCTSLTSITIPDSVTSIGSWAFKNCSSLTSIVIPDSVTNIGRGAFCSCDSLTSIVIPDSVTNIGRDAFEYCYSLTSIVIPDSVTSIGRYAFSDCTSLLSIAIPDSVTSIGDGAFENCTSLTSIVIPDSVTSIGDSAFYSCDSLTSIVIPDSVTSIGDSAFSETAYYNNSSNWANDVLYIDNALIQAKKTLSGEYAIKEGTTVVADDAFENCTSLTSITIPDSITSIGSWAFENCTSLTSITIPDSVTSIGSWAFENCSSLTSITIPDSVTNIGHGAFYSCDSLTSIVIPDSVTSIGDSFFSCCDSLTSIVIPDSVTSIGDSAFSYCDSLTSIVIPDSVTNIGSHAFSATAYSMNSSNWTNDVLYIDNALIQAKETLSGEYVIKEGTTVVAGSAFIFCDSLTSIVIPDSVTSIGDSAFSCCDSLTSIVIPDSVTSIGGDAFHSCDSLTSIIIPDSVTSIGGGAFGTFSDTAYYNNSSNWENDVLYIDNALIRAKGTLSGEYAIKEGTTVVAGNAFYSCDSLTSIVIPDSVTSIGDGAFENCPNLTSIIISNSVTRIGGSAFYDCDSFTDVYFKGTEDQWNAIEIDDYNERLISATIHFEDEKEQPSDETTSTFQQLYFEEPIVILDIGERKTLNVHSHDVANVNGELVYSNDKVVDFSELQWSSLNFGDTPIVTVNDKGQIVGNSEGLKWLSVRSKDDINLSASCQVYVGNPNSLEFSSKYDSKQYYAEGGFYSELSSISDCVEVYLLFENKLAEELEEISGIDVAIKSDTEKQRFKDIAPIKLTATINGNGLSFDRNSYQNTYTTTLNGISVGEAVDDILMLFPNDLSVAPSGNNYIIKVTLESDSFETITEEYSFTVENLETKSANEHIDFVSSNKDYKVSKQNIYGETMITLKNDAEYKWSKYSTLDFDNYYEIVLADVIISMLQVNQVEIHSLVSSVLKEWHGTYKTLLGGITTIVEDNYADQFGNTERKIDKLLKKSKYETDGIYVKDELHETVMDLLGNANNANKINNVFKAMDKTGQVFGMVNLGGNILSDAVDWGNKISIFNAYANADNEFKAVMKTFADSIPESEKKMREAIYDYVNYAESDSGQISELLESFSGLMKNVTLDVFSSCVGGRMIDYLGVQLVNWVGTATVGGVAFSTTATFATVKTTLGSISTGVTLGLCFSDLICDSSGKAAEMGKVVAMSEFSPYVTQALLHYENKLKEDKNISATTYYEYAFALHKATQSYIMQHTVNSLEVKRDSIIIKLFGRDDYDGLISEILAHKSAVDNLKCHSSDGASTISYKTKVIAIKCPVDVYIYDENGTEVVRIVDDVSEYVSEGINVFVDKGEKYVAVPANQEYSLKIVARDSGTMDYSVAEFADGAQKLRTVQKSDIPLESQREFTGKVVAPMWVETESYALSYNNEVISPDEIIVFAQLGDVNKDGNLNIKDATAIQKYLASLIEFDGDAKSVADYDGDTKITIKDATAIQKKLAGLI